MSTEYDPASWHANRTEAGTALLGMVWSSTFAGIAAGISGTNDEGADWAGVLLTLAGLCGLMTLISLTIIGWRLAFIAPPGTPSASWETEPQNSPSAAPPAGPGTPSVRIVEPEPRSDARVIVLLILGGIMVVVLVSAVLVNILG